MQCPRIQSPTESPPLKPQPNSAESLNPQTNVAEQAPQLPSIPSGAPTSVLTCPPLTPAPRRRKSLKIKQPTKISNLPPPPPLIPAPRSLANDPKPPRKPETKKKWREVDENQLIQTRSRFGKIYLFKLGLHSPFARFREEDPFKIFLIFTIVTMFVI